MRDGSDPDLHNGGGGGSVYDPDLDQDDRSSVHSSCSSYSQRGRRMRRRRRRSGSCHSNRGGPADRSGGYRGGRGRSRNPSGGQEPARRPGSRDRNRYYDRESYGDRGRGRGRGWDPPSRGGGGERGRGRGRESFGTHDDWPEEDRFGGGHRNSSRNHNEDLRRDSNRDRPRNLDAYPSEWERERGPSHSRGGRNSYRGGRNHWEEEDGKKGPRQDYGNYHRGRNDENRSPRQEQSAGDGRHPLRRPTGEDWSEDRVGNVLKEIRHGPGPSRPPPAPMLSAQARLERARNSPRVSSQQANVDLGPVGKEKEKSPSIPRGEGLDWTCGDPGCGWANVSEAEKCEKCHLTYQETIELTAQKSKLILPPVVGKHNYIFNTFIVFFRHKSPCLLRPRDPQSRSQV